MTSDKATELRRKLIASLSGSGTPEERIRGVITIIMDDSEWNDGETKESEEHAKEESGESKTALDLFIDLFPGGDD